MNVLDEPEAIRLARQFHAALLARDDATMLKLGRAYLKLQTAMEAQLEGVVAYLEGLRAQGIVPNAAQVYREERVIRLLAQLEAEIGKYADWVGGVIADNQKIAIESALSDAAQAVRLAYAEAHAGGATGALAAGFDSLPTSAFAAMVGQAADGTPLAALIKESFPQVAQQFLTQLVNGIGMGKNPRAIAAGLSRTLNVPLQRALLISRTETMRAYQTATMQTYRENGVQWFERISAKDDRVCLACTALEGEILSTELQLDDHPPNRCAVVPLLEPRGHDWQSGEAWMKTQDESTQLRIMGRTRMEAWKDGKVAFSDFAKHTTDPRWGGSVSIPTLKDLGLLQDAVKAA